MATRNQRLAATRLTLHDMACSNGTDCSSRADHAKRTQTDSARRVVDGGWADLLDVVHKSYHPRCDRSGDQLAGHMRTDALILHELAAAAGIRLANDATTKEGARP